MAHPQTAATRPFENIELRKFAAVQIPWITIRWNRCSRASRRGLLLDLLHPHEGVACGIRIAEGGEFPLRRPIQFPGEWGSS
jgi:hypothetical protein